MREPRDTGLSSHARELIEIGRSATLPTGADEARVLETLRVRLAALPALADPFQPSGLPRRSIRPGWKWWAAAGVGVALTAAAAVSQLSGRVTTRPRPPTSEESALQPSAIPESAEAREDSQRSEVVSLPAPPTAVLPVPSPSRKRQTGALPTQTENHLAEEVALLSKATSALHSGRAQEALSVLAEHQRRFPAGALSPQRRAARARALCQLGRMAEARAELARLDESSPLASRTREFCGFTK